MSDADFDPILIHPRKGKREKNIPPRGLLLVNSGEAEAQQQRLLDAGGRRQFLLNSQLVIDRNNKLFLAGPALGAPMATMSLEKLIALGARDIILFGWCGGLASDLAVGDVLVPTFALSGEGTSAHYPVEQPLRVSPALRDEVCSLFEGASLDCHDGGVWSTDAIYRENRLVLKQLACEEGIVGVDMEFAALCAVAAFRNVRFAAVLVVSDLLYLESWKPGFSKSEFLENKKNAIQTLVHGLAGVEE